MDIAEFNSTFAHLANDGGDMSLIGKRVTFKGVKKSHGEIHRYGVFEIIGHQFTHDGRPAYRVKCVEFRGEPYNDLFGLVMLIDECQFVSENK